MKKIKNIYLILSLLLIVFNSGYSQNVDPKVRSTIVITDSLIASKLKLSPSLVLAPIVSIPIGLLNSGAIIISPTIIPTIIHPGLIGFGTTLIHPIFIGKSIYNLKKHKIKKQLLEQYSDYLIIDKSSINLKNIPKYQIYAGLNYSTFNTTNISTKPNISFGIKYTKPFTKYLSFSTKLNFSKQNIEIYDKKY